MKTLIVLALISALVLWYALWGRAWLKKKPWAAGFFAWIEPIEIKLYKKSETILLARLKMLVGVLLTVLTYLGTIDLTPLMPFVPDEWEPLLKSVFNLIPLTLSLLGLIDEKLRNQTTAPVEIVAAPEAKLSTEAKEAIAVADLAKQQAITAIKQDTR